MKTKKDRFIEFDFSRLEPWKNDILTFMGQLLSARLKQRISQEELAKRMNVNQSVVSRFEHAGRMPTFEFLYKVAKALELNLLITPYGDRAIILSPEQAETVKRQITPEKPDIYSVVSEMIDNCSADVTIDISEEDADTNEEYIYKYAAENSNYPLAAQAFNTEIQ